METKLIPLAIKLEDIDQIQGLGQFKNRLNVRTMNADEFIEQHASGTLRKNKKVGFAWKSQYKEERVAYEFGWEFQILPTSRVTVGKPITEGDCSAATETGWHTERMIEMSVFEEDVFRVAYIQYEVENQCVEGLGVVVEQTSAAWIGEGMTVFAIIAEYDKNDADFKQAVNPF